MKKHVSVICILLSLLLAFSALTACGGSKTDENGGEPQQSGEASAPAEDTAGEPAGENGSGKGKVPDEGASESATADEKEGGSESEPPRESTSSVPVSRPAAAAQEVRAYDVSFYLPESLIANEWNGMMGVYDFYTGIYSGTRPTGMDFVLTISSDSAVDGELTDYARTASEKETGAPAEPEEVTYNGGAWVRVSPGADYVNYYALFNGSLYEIETRRGGDTAENYAAALQMLEQTLALSAQ